MSQALTPSKSIKQHVDRGTPCGPVHMGSWPLRALRPVTSQVEGLVRQ